MARFYGSMKGSAKTEATRRGNGVSGIEAHIRGWDVGVKVIGLVNGYDQDAFNIYLTGGSNNGTGIGIGTVTIADGQLKFIPSGLGK